MTVLCPLWTDKTHNNQQQKHHDSLSHNHSPLFLLATINMSANTSTTTTTTTTTTPTTDFSLCKLLPVVLSNDASSSSSCAVVAVNDSSSSEHKKYKTSSFYLDSSGRASISLPLQLEFPSEESLRHFQDCLEPKPVNNNNNKSAAKDEEGNNDETTTSSTTTTTTAAASTQDPPSPPPKRRISIEAKVTLSIGSGEAIVATVEKVTVQSTKQQLVSSSNNNNNNNNNIVIFETDIIVRVSRAGTAGAVVPSSSNGDASSGAKADLEIAAVLLEQSDATATATAPTAKQDTSTTMKYSQTLDGLTLLNLGGAAARRRRLNSNNILNSNNTAVRYTRTKPFTLQASLTNALSISVVSIPGPVVGHTLLGLTIQHTGTHTEDICITNIALHPSHSRECNGGNRGVVPAAAAAAAGVVKDTSKLVQWGYARQSDPDLPLTLQCHEAFSTILAVDATQDSKCRKFTCPVSVTAVLGFQQTVDTTAIDKDEKKKNSQQQQQQRHRYQVIAVAEAEWETSKPAIEPTDGFRVDLTLGDDGSTEADKSHTCKVGAPLTVQVQVRNLSTQPRDVMILIPSGNRNKIIDGDDYPNNSDGSGSGDALQVYIAEKDGYKLGIKGVDHHRSLTTVNSGDDSQDLISVDVAYLLGVLQAQSTAKASLRFIPLREGFVKIPNLQLVDKKTGKRYACLHKLRASVQSA